MTLAPTSFGFSGRAIAVGGSCRHLGKRSIVASPGAGGDGHAVGVPGFLYRRVGRCLNVLCKLGGGSHVFAIAGDCLRRRVSEKTGTTNIGHVHVRSLHRDRVSLLVSVNFSTITVTSQINRRDVSVACRCTRLFPSGRVRVTRGLSSLKGKSFRGIDWRREWRGSLRRCRDEISDVTQEGQARWRDYDSVEVTGAKMLLPPLLGSKYNNAKRSRDMWNIRGKVYRDPYKARGS